MVHTLYIYLFRQLRYHTLRSALCGVSIVFGVKFLPYVPPYDHQYAKHGVKKAASNKRSEIPKNVSLSQRK